MKLLASILAFLVLVLGTAPCFDRQDECGTAIGHGKTSHNTDPGNDECSPFCHCACCSNVSVDHIVADIEPAIFYQKKERTIVDASSVIHRAIPVWQPPQLSA